MYAEQIKDILTTIKTLSGYGREDCAKWFEEDGNAEKAQEMFDMIHYIARDALTLAEG